MAALPPKVPEEDDCHRLINRWELRKLLKRHTLLELAIESLERVKKLDQEALEREAAIDENKIRASADMARSIISEEQTHPEEETSGNLSHLEEALQMESAKTGAAVEKQLAQLKKR